MLSKRLTAVAELVSGSSIVDVGTDHAYLPIYMLKQGWITHAVASDVREGPLSRAKANIEEEALSDKIVTRLSDGLSEIALHEADSLVMAGMGGHLMMRILSEEKEKADSFFEWILQPQSDIPAVRAFVGRMGRWIMEERIVLEDGKWYFTMRAVPGQEETDACALYAGPRLLEDRDPLLEKWLRVQEKQKEELLEFLVKETDHKGRSALRICELKEELDLIREAQRRIR